MADGTVDTNTDHILESLDNLDQQLDIIIDLLQDILKELKNEKEKTDNI